MSSTILSTKLLTASQKSLILHSGIGMVDYNAINVEMTKFDFTQEDFDHLVFTSQNGVRSFIDNTKAAKNANRIVFCVGEKTKKLLEENRFQVVEMAQNASKLGQIIAKSYKNYSFLLFLGNLRRHELPQVFRKYNIRYKEVLAYHTTFNERVFNREFDGILFFSPSGVKSFGAKNDFGKAVSFCIGETTAGEAKKYTNSIVIAKKATIENTIVQAIKQLKQ